MQEHTSKSCNSYTMVWLLFSLKSAKTQNREPTGIFRRNNCCWGSVWILNQYETVFVISYQIFEVLVIWSERHSHRTFSKIQNIVNIILIENICFNLFWKCIYFCSGELLSIIPFFSITRFFRKHADLMLKIIHNCKLLCPSFLIVGHLFHLFILINWMHIFWTKISSWPPTFEW